MKAMVARNSRGTSSDFGNSKMRKKLEILDQMAMTMTTEISRWNLNMQVEKILSELRNRHLAILLVPFFGMVKT